MNSKFVIYQLFPRLFTNCCDSCVKNGTIEQNGVGKMNEITPTVLKSIKELGVTHIWYTGVIEHATKSDYTMFGISRDNPHIVKGNAGSPYAITDYYDIDPDIATDVVKRMDEFEALVRRTHRQRLKVLIDFVPNHVARQYRSDAKPDGIEDLGALDDTTYFFKSSNNFYYIPRQRFSPALDLGCGDDAYIEFPAKATGNDCFSAFPSVNDWYETVKLNYGIDYGDGSRHFDPIPDTWFKMLNIMRFWASKGIDGFRCDMAFMVPVEFWAWAIPQVKEKYPEIIFIAEIYDVNQYRNFLFNGCFDYLYDKVNLYDTLRSVECHGVSAASITNCWQTIDGIGDKMLNFLENHDEQRFASKYYAGNAALVLPSLVVSATIGKAPFMIYQGQELGEPAMDAEGFSGDDGRTTIFDYWSIPSVRRWYNVGKCDGAKSKLREKSIRGLYRKVLNLALKEKAISEGGFFDLMYVNYDSENFDPHRMYCYLRAYAKDVILVAVNFGDNEANVAVNIPYHAFETLSVEQGEYRAEDLLSGTTVIWHFESSTPVRFVLPAHGAVMWKLTRTRNEVSYKKSGSKTSINKLK